jgi:UDP-2,3-diacylglucosamine hydrolase
MTSIPGPEQKAQPQAVALFVSDVHLQESMHCTVETFLRFLSTHAPRARQLYLLGDLFEYWAGDDDIDAPLHRRIVDALHAVSEKGVAVFWMAGNRDFLVSDVFAAAAGLTRIDDPHVTRIAGHNIVLAHGDAQCTDDTTYMTFRAQVRDPKWQQAFLAMPLAQRKAIIAGLRDGSREAQRLKSYDIMDVNTEAIDALFEASQAGVMIHGHTHRPAMHRHRGGPLRRYVLPDWDCDGAEPRGGWLAICDDGSIRRYDFEGNQLP